MTFFWSTYIAEQHLFSMFPSIKYPCGQCEYQATQKGNLVQHRRSAHEGIKYSCGKCVYQATRKVNLYQHIVSS